MNLGKRLFESYWHMIAHRRELPSDGDYLKFKTPIGDVVVFNDGGDFVAFDNRCPHRGALIYPDVFGNQPATCKYHGWTYKSGHLSIPSVERFLGCDIARAALNKFELDWCGDFLFLGVEPKSDLYEQLNGVSSYIENISFNISGRLDVNSYEYECYWPIALENALEPYHIGMVHPNTLATLKLEDGVNSFYGSNSVWEAPVGNLRIKKQLEKLERFFNIDYSYQGYMSIFMFPFTMISSTYGYSYSLQNFFPDDKSLDRTHFMSRLLTSNLSGSNALSVVGSFFESTAKVNRMVFDEDHSICKMLPADAWSPEPLKFMSNEEVKIEHFREYCRQNAF